MPLFSLLIFFLVLLPQLQPSFSSKILVDGVSEWKDPTVHIGDAIVFKHKYHYDLYIFQNQKAFDVCNFTQATLLSKPNIESYTWYPSRLGFFYFCFNDGSLKTCQASQKLAIEVSSTSSPPPEPPTSTMAPQLSPVGSPGPSSGGVISSSPAFLWPFRPHQEASQSPAPDASSPVTMPLVPNKNGGIPFISSNPAVPLPTDEVDSATIRPLPISGNERQMANALLSFQMAFALVVFLMP